MLSFCSLKNSRKMQQKFPINLKSDNKSPIPLLERQGHPYLLTSPQSTQYDTRGNDLLPLKFSGLFHVQMSIRRSK
jgi:hypothetical protein